MSGDGIALTEGSFRTNDLRFHYRGWGAAAPAAALLIVPGLADHSGRYDEVGRSLAALGVSTWAVDMRGHGMSEGPRGHTPRFRCFLDDLERFRTEVRGRIEPGTPLYLLGHSMGGLIALRYLEEHPDAFHGCIVVSPWLATAAPVPRWKTLLAGVLARVAPALPMRARVPSEYLSHDPDVVQAYRADPLVHDRITPRLFSEISAAWDLVFRRSDRVRVPLLFLLAGSDRIVDTGRSLAFARGVATADVRLLEGLYHEVLNEPDSAVYVGQIAAWIRAQAVARAGETIH